MRWTVIIPLKALPQAKSRLMGATADEAAHAELVRAIRADTIAAARAADSVARVLIVADAADAADVDGREVLVQSRPGLNAALAEASGYAAQRWPADGVAALVGDLPALTAAELVEALAGATRYSRGYVPDTAATGTTLLTVTPGVPMEPKFGAGSAARHASTATELTAGAGLRTDVDTPADLEQAERLGLGTHTRALRCPQPSTC